MALTAICAQHSVIKSHSFSVLQGGVLSLTDWHALHCLCPILQMFLKHHLDAEAVPTSLSQLLSAAMQVLTESQHC